MNMRGKPLSRFNGLVFLMTNISSGGSKVKFPKVLVRSKNNAGRILHPTRVGILQTNSELLGRVIVLGFGFQFIVGLGRRFARAVTRLACPIERDLRHREFAIGSELRGRIRVNREHVHANVACELGGIHRRAGGDHARHVAIDTRDFDSRVRG